MRGDSVLGGVRLWLEQPISFTVAAAMHLRCVEALQPHLFALEPEDVTVDNGADACSASADRRHNRQGW